MVDDDERMQTGCATARTGGCVVEARLWRLDALALKRTETDFRSKVASSQFGNATLAK